MRKAATTITIVAAIALSIVLAPPVLARTVYERDSLYSHITVEEAYGVRGLYFNGWPQSEMLANDPYRGGLEYTEMFHAALAFKPGAKRVLMLGLGGGSTQKAFYDRYPDISLRTVEIDQVVAKVAKEYFSVPEDGRHAITLQDARRFLAGSNETWDAIIVDAYFADYYGNYAPFHLATKEFFALVKSHLSPGGVMAYNVIWPDLNWGNVSLRVMHRTVSSVFGGVYLAPARRSRNIVFFCTAGEAPSVSTLRSSGAAVDQKYGKLPTSVAWVASQLVAQQPNTRGLPVLTDDYAPVETLSLVFR
jgi:spermidine synthase